MQVLLCLHFPFHSMHIGDESPSLCADIIFIHLISDTLFFIIYLYRELTIMVKKYEKVPYL